MSPYSDFPDFLYEPVEVAARELLGCVLERQLDGQTIRVRIVETEAYDQDDEASHAYGGKRGRNATMFSSGGHLYVYFSYGMHYCCNVVTGQSGYGAGVLLRAVEPLDSFELLKTRRGVCGYGITNGPAKLTQALGIDMAFNGHDLHEIPLRLFMGSLYPGESVAHSPRIGIGKARDAPRRFFIAGNPYVSR